MDAQRQLDLDAQLRAAGIPIQGVSDVRANCRIIFASEATAQHKSDAAAMLAAFDWDGFDHTRPRAEAIELVTDATTQYGKAHRGVAIVLLAELNDLRTWVRDFKVAVANAATLAALKTAVAALPNLPDRTLAQVKTAVTNAINGGGAD